MSSTHTSNDASPTRKGKKVWVEVLEKEKKKNEQHRR